MTFPQEIEQRLGFDQVRNRITRFCSGPLSVKLSESMSFLSDYHHIKLLLLQSNEFKLIIESGKEFPSTVHTDHLPYFNHAAIEGTYLEEEAFIELLNSLRVIFNCKKFFLQHGELYPELQRLALEVPDLAKIIQSIDQKFDDKGKIKDNASAELARIRKKVREEQSRVKRLLESLFRHAVDEGWVPEGASSTIRDGRLVIPVVAEHKRKLKGFIMDESATGQTVYIEPAEALEANNEIRDLLHAERREVIKILKDLTTILRVNLTLLNPAFYFLGLIDFIKAKAKYAIDIRAELPNLVEYPDLNWLHARHPLLYLSLKGKREVVPLTIDLTASQPFLLVSGPNAGGKSVCLKTVGLLQYMVQCGILPSMHDKSTVGIFKKIFLDIGDQQSIENDLSTYSSHLRNLNFFVRNADSNTLVLMDELGSGTDPNFGGGISESILTDLLERKVWGIATTHYYNLKLFAGSHSGIRNGAMQFNAQLLEPLFVLEIGKPGSSFALEIARKTGLPAKTLMRAEEIIGKELTGLETLMKSVADEKQHVEKMKKEIGQREHKLQETLSHYQKLLSELRGKEKEIINKAKEEASQLLKETNREIEKTIRHIKENKAEKKETRKVRQGLEILTTKVQTHAKPIESRKEKISIGDKVRLIGQEVTGTVLSMKDANAVVQFGDLRSNVKVKQLIRSDQIEVKSILVKARSLGIDVMRKQSTFDNTLDIRGKRVEEVIPVLDQFIDDAILLGQSQLKIIHGKGEGVLRKVVREHLRKVKEVASLADEHADRGGDGITYVVLK
jgi:DNA mismatch repair protein MutS2